MSKVALFQKSKKFEVFYSQIIIQPVKTSLKLRFEDYKQLNQNDNFADIDRNWRFA